MKYNNLRKLLVPLLSLTMLASFTIDHQPTTAQAASKRAINKAYQAAESKLGSPYSYGSVGPTAFDCSGFTQYIYKQANVNLARTAQGQFNTTRAVEPTELKKGDLVYFGSSADSIYHVGFYIGNGQMIDAQNNGVVTENINSPWWNLVAYSRP
ncbi:C40 family peptidase [Lactobacillaceae bacterium Melli_B4]